MWPSALLLNILCAQLNMVKYLHSFIMSTRGKNCPFLLVYVWHFKGKCIICSYFTKRLRTEDTVVYSKTKMHFLFVLSLPCLSITLMPALMKMKLKLFNFESPTSTTVTLLWNANQIAIDFGLALHLQYHSIQNSTFFWNSNFFIMWLLPNYWLPSIVNIIKICKLSLSIWIGFHQSYIRIHHFFYKVLKAKYKMWDCKKGKKGISIYNNWKIVRDFLLPYPMYSSKPNVKCCYIVQFLSKLLEKSH